MIRRGIAALYAQLAPEERFALAVKALARGDLEEARRLRDTCPMKVYRMTDQDYSRRVEGAFVTAQAAAYALAQAAAKLRMAVLARDMVAEVMDREIEQRARVFVDGYNAGAGTAWRLAGEQGEPPALTDADYKELEHRLRVAIRGNTGDPPGAWVFEEMIRDLAAEPRAIWEAFSRVCRQEMGVEPEELLRVCCPPVLKVLQTLEETPAVAPDPRVVEDYTAALRDLWRTSAV